MSGIDNSAPRLTGNENPSTSVVTATPESPAIQ